MAAQEKRKRVGESQLKKLESELARQNALAQETRTETTTSALGLKKTEHVLPTVGAAAADRKAKEIVKTLESLKKRLTSIFGERSPGVRAQTGGSALTSGISELPSLSELV